LAALKADILADPAFTTGSPAPKDTPDGRFAIAAAYNLQPAQDWWVWKSQLAKSDAVNSTSVDGTTFNWSGNGFISRTVQELMTWENLWNSSASVDPSLAQVRAGFAAIFTGGTNAAANLTHLQAMARRKATRAEKLFSSGTGSSASPATMGAGARDLILTFADVDAALNLP
jgi:hypothetical protein